MHFAEELTGRYRKDRRPLGALALGDPSHATCVSNDYGFDHVFSRQIEGLARKGDLLLGLSTSGNSKNVILAFEAAKKLMLEPLRSSDQELHIKIIPIAIEVLERRLFSENYL